MSMCSWSVLLRKFSTSKSRHNLTRINSQLRCVIISAVIKQVQSNKIPYRLYRPPVSTPRASAMSSPPFHTSSSTWTSKWATNSPCRELTNTRLCWRSSSRRRRKFIRVWMPSWTTRLTTDYGKLKVSELMFRWKGDCRSFYNGIQLSSSWHCIPTGTVPTCCLKFYSENH